jgi:hypothetical protein
MSVPQNVKVKRIIRSTDNIIHSLFHASILERF